MKKTIREINYKELAEFLQTLKASDFSRPSTYEDVGNDIKIKIGYSIDDLDRFYDNKKIPADQVIHYGTSFLIDAVGNDLSIVILSRRKYKLPTGRLIRAKFDRTLVDDCKKLYGTPLNGYWMIPDRFFVTEK